MLPIRNENDSGSIFLLSGTPAIIDELVSMQLKKNTWDDATQQIRINMTDLYATGESEIQESNRLHVVDMTPPVAEGDDGEPNSELWGRLVAEISYIASLKSVIHDHKSLHDTLLKDFARVTLRKGPRVLATDVSETISLTLGDVDLYGMPYIENYIHHEDAHTISKFLCEWPVLVLASSESSPGQRKSFVMPLDPVEDVVFLAKAFRKELDKFLKSPNTENHFDFSLFSALHVMEILTTLDSSEAANEDGGGRSKEDEAADRAATAWIPFYLRPGQLLAHEASENAITGPSVSRRNSQDLLGWCAEVGRAILCNHFCAYQLLRFVCLFVKSGFDELIDQDTNEKLPFYKALLELSRSFTGMSICKQIGLRCSYSPVKYAALLMYGISRQAPATISHADLLRLTQYKRLECDVRDSFPGQFYSYLPIQTLSEFSTKVFEQTPIIKQDVSSSELGTAFERLRQIGISASTNQSVWFRFNSDLFFLSTLAHRVMKGEISRKSITTIWALPRSTDPNVQWVALFAAGYAFAIELPAKILDYLVDGHLKCGDVREIFEESTETETFVVHLDNKDLPWQNCVERLKEMFRLKNSWTKLELSAWLDRCLTRSSEPIDHIIQKYLTSNGGLLYENVSLHLEKKSI